MSFEWLIIEPLIVCLPYSDLIALAGTCTTIRNKILRTAKWRNILTDWKREVAPPHCTLMKHMFDDKWWRVHRRGVANKCVYAKIVESELKDKKHFTLSDVHVVCVSVDSQHYNYGPKEVFTLKSF